MYECIEEWKVNSNDTKLRIIIKKVKTYELALTKVEINSEISRVQMTYTYENVVSHKMNMVNLNTIPDMRATKCTRSNINEV